MTDFVGRDAELGRLERELDGVRQSGRGRFVWMRGRRRVGKSRLVQEFCDRSGLPYCFYQAVQRPRDEAIAEFAAAAAQSTLASADLFEGASFGTWTASLRSAAVGATPDRPAVLVLDELPYLTERDDGFASDLQRAWDRDLERAPVLLIGMGSDVRMMRELVRERAPLHGRPTWEAAIGPLPLPAVQRITGAQTASDTIDRYLIVGGFPLLAATWPASASVEEFLAEALHDDHPLVTAAERIMASEFESALNARRVVEAIGHGERARTTIERRAGVGGNTLDGALGLLAGPKGMVERRTPYAVPPGSKFARYTLTDPYLRFWLRFVGPHLPEIARGRGDLVAARVRRDWQSFRGRAVEPLVRSSLERLLADPARAAAVGGVTVVGGWWTRDNSVEVDLVGGDGEQPTKVGFIGSIKWHETQRFTAAEREALAAQRARVPGAHDAALVAVSRTGLDADVEVDVEFGPSDLVAAWDV